MTGRKKGVSIGAAMKQRMGQGEITGGDPAPVLPPSPPPTDVLESFNTRLPAGLHRRLKMHAAAEGRKIQDVVQEALTAYLEKKD